MEENFCLKIDYFRIDENDFETDLRQIIETYLKLCLFFILGGGPTPYLRRISFKTSKLVFFPHFVNLDTVIGHSVPNQKCVK